MLRPRFAFVLGAMAAVGLATAGCADQSAAIRVGDETVSEQELTDEMTALRDSEPALQLIHSATRDDIAGEMGDDSYGRPFVGYMVTQRVVAILQERLAEQEGIEPSDDAIESIRSSLEDQLAASGGDIADLPEGFVDQLVEDVAISQALGDGLAPEDYQAGMLELLDTTEIELSSHFGEWNGDVLVAALQGQQQGAPVTPPAGPQPAPGDESGADVGLPAG